MVIQEILNEDIVSRSVYLKQIEGYLGSPLIKVLTGQRRVGKSSIMKLVIQKLYKDKTISKENIFYINKEFMAFDHINSYQDLKGAFSVFLKQKNKGKIFVGIDEIQEVSGWEKFINGLLAEYGEKIEIFITGSNSFLLSSELSTYLTGRYIEFNIYSLSFNEFSQFKDEKKSKQLFLEYLKLGGMPAIFKMNYSEEIIYPYLSGVYNTIIIKDILSHYTIKNIVFFKDLYKYTISNIGNVISGATIKAYLRSQKISLGNDTVLNYLQYAQDVFLLNRVKSINPHTKKYFEIYNKYYVSDLGLRNSIVGFDFSRDIGQLLENYVFLELKRSGYDVIIGRFANGKEVDFIATKLGITKYFQVSYLLGSEETILREYSSLQQIHDNWDKYVVSMDEIDIPPSGGIKHVNILDLETVL